MLSNTLAGEAYWCHKSRYHEAISVVARFDRGESKRAIYGLDETSINVERRFGGMDRTVSKVEALVEHAERGVQMQKMSEVRRGKQKQ